MDFELREGNLAGELNPSFSDLAWPPNLILYQSENFHLPAWKCSANSSVQHNTAQHRHSTGIAKPLRSGLKLSSAQLSAHRTGHASSNAATLWYLNRNHDIPSYPPGRRDMGPGTGTDRHGYGYLHMGRPTMHSME